MCTIYENHMMYVFWEMEHDRHNFFSFWTIFYPFTPPNNPENQNFEKIKRNAWKYHYLTQVYHKWQSYDVWFVRYGAQQNFLLFWAIFCRFTSLTAQKINISKKWKKLLEISFYTCVPKIMIRWCIVPEISCAMDGQMDRWTDKRTDGRTNGQTDIKMLSWSWEVTKRFSIKHIWPICLLIDLIVMLCSCWINNVV